MVKTLDGKMIISKDPIPKSEIDLYSEPEKKDFCIRIDADKGYKSLKRALKFSNYSVLRQKVHSCCIKALKNKGALFEGGVAKAFYNFHHPDVFNSIKKKNRKYFLALRVRIAADLYFVKPNNIVKSKTLDGSECLREADELPKICNGGLNPEEISSEEDIECFGTEDEDLLGQVLGECDERKHSTCDIRGEHPSAKFYDHQRDIIF